MYNIIHQWTMVFCVHPLIDDILCKTKKRIPANSPGKSVAAGKMKKRSISDAIRNTKDSGRVAVIAEVKPASPRGKIRDMNPDDAASVAKIMEEAGASAISVLTEPDYFNGSPENLKQVRENVGIPVLRKDFIIDERQIFEYENDMILLIAAVLRDKLPHFVDVALSGGVEPLVEIHNIDDLGYAFASEARMLGINNRDLNTLEVDLATTEKLLPLIRSHEKEHNKSYLVVSESGMGSPVDTKRMTDAGADALLIGTSIMKGDVYRNTRDMVTCSGGAAK
jgi:indole-3-glycerol phosphate synthase